MALTAGGDPGIELQGIPPYLTLTPVPWPSAFRGVPGR
jgi:hypothetical protein